MVSAQSVTVTYTLDPDSIANPERGFYKHTETHSTGYSPLSATSLAIQRITGNHTLILRVFYLEDFVSDTISASYLSAVQQDFDSLRTAGVKAVIRFAYTNEVNGGMGGWPPVPPFGDAPVAQIHSHIAQLKPLIQANQDVIAAVQMGFIGIWGEGYYTDYFADSSALSLLSSTHWTDRGLVLDSLLQAIPTDLMVQVRYPQQKQKAIYGPAASVDPAVSLPLDGLAAFSGSKIARIGFHNDCFLASDEDFGTYVNYDISTGDTTNLKPYLAADGAYVVAGGETCFLNPPRSGCSASGGDADTELRRFHYSYLNQDYNHAVNSTWNGICREEITKNLGYRFQMISGTYSTQAQPGQIITLELTLNNVGYAPVYRAKSVEVILRNTISGGVYTALLPHDLRTWGPDSIVTLSDTLCIPAGMPLGTYDLLLHLADPSVSIHDRPEYSIRMANIGAWEAVTGYNSLNHQIEINATALSSMCAGEITFTGDSLLTNVGRMAKEMFRLYPNPAKDQFVVQLKSPFQKAVKWELRNALGQLIKQSELNIQGSEFQVSTKGIAEGMYYFKLTLANTTFSQKVVIAVGAL